MITYNDYLMVKDKQSTEELLSFVHSVISNHKNSDAFKLADIAEDYDKRKNRTIVNYQKLLYTASGEGVPDIYGANYKLASGFFQRFNIQGVQYLLGNGITWGDPATADRLGNDFEKKVQTLAGYSKVGGVAFGFFNLDHLEVFKLTEFAPLFDEEDGSLKAGVRFWQIESNKPLRATFYEMDGYTEMVWGRRELVGGTVKVNGAEILREKRPYKIKVNISDIDGTEIYDGENYPSFPIVPLWANKDHQSEIVGLREQIDCYDLIKSGYANTIDEASFIYWTIQNAGGMDDIDLQEFVDHMRRVRAAVVSEEGASAESHSIEAPYQGREALLQKLRDDLYDDAMALDVKSLASGAKTATEIEASYEPLNNKTDDFEYHVTSFLEGILSLAGIEDEPTFSRSVIVNNTEKIQVVLQASQYLDDDYVTTKLLTLLGDGDMAEDMLKQMDADGIDRMTEEETEEEPEEDIDTSEEEAEIDTQMIDEYASDVEAMLKELMEG